MQIWYEHILVFIVTSFNWIFANMIHRLNEDENISSSEERLKRIGENLMFKIRFAHILLQRINFGYKLNPNLELHDILIRCFHSPPDYDTWQDKTQDDCSCRKSILRYSCSGSFWHDIKKWLCGHLFFTHFLLFSIWMITFVAVYFTSFKLSIWCQPFIKLYYSYKLNLHKL